MEPWRALDPAGELVEERNSSRQLSTDSLQASRSRHRALAKPFMHVATVMELKEHITPRAMRRTFQDLARAAEVKDTATRDVSGHATESMQRHYSTVNSGEMREGLAKAR